MTPNYEKFPSVAVNSGPRDCLEGWPAIWDNIRRFWTGTGVLAIECYPGVIEDDVVRSVSTAIPDIRVLRVQECYLESEVIRQLLQHELTNDRVFGRITSYTLEDLIDPGRLRLLRNEASAPNARTVVIGTGATLVVNDPELLVYADMARWEIQKRQRQGLAGSLGMHDAGTSAASLYKRGFFVDWPLADRVKQRLLPRADFLLDTNTAAEPKMVSGRAYREALASTVKQPFRLVPFFDPGPWGGQWMRRVCGLPDGPANYAWCFDCVPEENSLLLRFGNSLFETPAQNLLLLQAPALLGDAVYGRFGTEFPIRFDFLDTMGGGNLSLQVHPLTEYIQQHFGMHFTQDESYYLLDAGEDACVYLGLRNEIEKDEMIASLYSAQAGGPPFPAERYVNRFPVRKHDHVSIPAGTVHCSGRNSMVLEISATPYIFTFKLWDWGRLGLDGQPRPIHLEHGIENIRWERDTEWVKRELLAAPEPVRSGDGWREERTGLHRRQFIETRRHWFTQPVPHSSSGGVEVLNLVQGYEAVVESPSGAFGPFPVHYAETFIMPAAAGDYTIRPLPGSNELHATVKARVRNHA